MCDLIGPVQVAAVVVIIVVKTWCQICKWNKNFNDPSVAPIGKNVGHIVKLNSKVLVFLQQNTKKQTTKW